MNIEEAKAKLKPEEILHPGAVDEFGGVIFPKANLTDHDWKQEGGPGGRINCKSCPMKHGFTPKPDEILTGIDANGYPVLQEHKHLA